MILLSHSIMWNFLSNIFFVPFFVPFFVTSGVAARYKRITPTHWDYLQSKIVCSQTTPSMKQKIETIVFHRHLPLLHRMTTDFRKFHRRKSQNILLDDMQAFAYKGLLDATRKYNGKHNFVHYAKIYIQGALYKSLTTHHPISTIPKDIHRKKTTQFDPYTYEKRKNMYLEKRDTLQSTVEPNNYNKHSHSIQYEQYNHIWDKIQTFSPFTSRCFRLKFNFFFQVVRSNKQVAELMCCSEELVRRHISTHILEHLVTPTSHIIL